MKELWYGSLTQPDSVGISDILFDKRIPYTKDNRYYQLNTTYVPGPGRDAVGDGRRARQADSAAPRPPAAAAVLRWRVNADDGNPPVDQRLNSTDPSANLNTGLRALVRADDSWLTPTDVEIGQAIEDAIKDAAGSSSTSGYTPYTPYGRSGYGGYGSGGGGSYSRLQSPVNNQTPYANQMQFINTPATIIRRSTIRRERFDSDRGRLNQWQ